MKRTLLPAIVLVFLTGCHTMNGRPTIGSVKTADGVPIAYETRGRGETTLVFVHCWCCDRAFWHNQMDEFARDYRVVAVDLAGFGESGKVREKWSIAKLGEDVATLIDKLGLKRVVIIGHSLGGPVSLEAARLTAGRTIGVVLVDTLQDVEMEYPANLLEQIATRFENDFEGTMEELVHGMFPPDANQEVVKFVLDKAKAQDQKAAVAVFRGFLDFDRKAAFTAARVPIRAINAIPHPPRGVKTAIETNRKYADFDAVFMDGVGHYLQLERPEEFNQLLREILEKMDTR